MRIYILAAAIVVLSLLLAFSDAKQRELHRELSNHVSTYNHRQDRVTVLTIGPTPDGPKLFRVRNYEKYQLEILVYDGADQSSQEHHLELESPEYSIAYVPNDGDGRIWIESTLSGNKQSSFRFEVPTGELDNWLPLVVTKTIAERPFSTMFFDANCEAQKQFVQYKDLDEDKLLCDKHRCRMVAFTLRLRQADARAD